MHRRKAQIRFVSSLCEPALLLLSGVKWSKCMPPPSTASIKNYKHLKKKKEKREKRGVGSPDLPEICCLGALEHGSVHLK